MEALYKAKHDSEPRGKPISLSHVVEPGDTSTETIRTLNRKLMVSDSGFALLDWWLELQEQGKDIAKYLIVNGYKTVAIYGLGRIGRHLLTVLNKHSVKVKYAIDEFLSKEHLVIKENWQLFKTESRPLDFLGYRFYRGYTTLRRSNFLRIKRRAKKMAKKDRITYHDAAAMLSYSGWLKHCNSYNYQQKYIKPYVDYKLCKEVIRNESKKGRKHNKT